MFVRRAGVATFFGGLLAKPYGHVQAMATAWATNAGPTVNCLKPFLIPDMWHESDKTTQDVNRNNYMEPDATAHGNQSGGGEQWFYQPAANGDYYAKYDPSVLSPPKPQTGYGTSHNGYAGDVGLPILFKPQTGNNQRQGNSYFTLDGPGRTCATTSSTVVHQRRGRRQPELVAGQRDPPGPARHHVPDQPGSGGELEPKHETDPGLGLCRSDAESPRVIIVGLMDPIYILQGDLENP